MVKRQFGLRSLLLVIAVLAALFAICAQWPVKESVPTLAKSSEGKTITIPHLVDRAPTPQEFAIRVAISSTVVAAATLFTIGLVHGLRESLSSRSTAVGQAPRA